MIALELVSDRVVQRKLEVTNDDGRFALALALDLHPVEDVAVGRLVLVLSKHEEARNVVVMRSVVHHHEDGLHEGLRRNLESGIDEQRDAWMAHLTDQIWMAKADDVTKLISDREPEVELDKSVLIFFRHGPVLFKLYHSQSISTRLFKLNTPNQLHFLLVPVYLQAT
jgi:hypothetical protein